MNNFFTVIKYLLIIQLFPNCFIISLDNVSEVFLNYTFPFLLFIFPANKIKPDKAI